MYLSGMLFYMKFSISLSLRDISSYKLFIFVFIYLICFSNSLFCFFVDNCVKYKCSLSYSRFWGMVLWIYKYRSLLLDCSLYFLALFVLLVYWDFLYSDIYSTLLTEEGMKKLFYTASALDIELSFLYGFADFRNSLLNLDGCLGGFLWRLNAQDLLIVKVWTIWEVVESLVKMFVVISIHSMGILKVSKYWKWFRYFIVV